MDGMEGLDSVLLEYSRDKLAVIDESGEFRYVNGASEAILGYAPEELVGDRSFEYVHPDDREAVTALFSEVIESDEVQTETIRYRHRAADGSWVWLESRFSNMTDERLGGYVVSSRDITAQVDAERERDTAETRLHEITDTVRDVVWMFSSNWEELLFVNPAYEDVYGQPVERIRENPSQFLEAVHPDDREHVRTAMDQLSAGKSINVEYRVNPAENYDTFVWIQGEPIVDGDDVVRITGFSRDITDRRRRERQLAVMDNLLRHNLRNDLTTIFQHTDFLVREGGEAAAERARLIRQKGEDLLESAEKQRQIIDLLTESPTPQTLDLAQLIGTATGVVSEQYPEVPITVDAPEAVPVRALHEVKIALIELLENGIEHDPGEPALSVTARPGDGSAAIRIADSCPPIPDAEFRVLTGEQEMTDIYHSSGIGLWLAYWVVDLSGGSIEFTRKNDVGNTITVHLPLAASD